MKALFFAALALGAWTGAAQDSIGSSLNGRVSGPDGNPAAATVAIVYGVQRTTDPSRQYARHIKPPPLARTDGSGRFQIPSLDPELVYGVVIAAPGRQTKILHGIDPAKEELTAQLDAVKPAAAAGGVLRGQISDAQGKAIPDALIRIGGVTRNGMTHWPASEIDFYAIADEAGAFAIRAPTPFDAAEGSAEARGFALGLFEGWKPGDKVHQLALSEGAAFRGRLRQAGQPVAGAEVRLDNFGRESGSSIWNYSVSTDKEGRFLFSNLPPNRSFNVYATMESLGSRGSLSKLQSQVHNAGSTNDIGDLALQPAYTIQGRIFLANGKSLPAGSGVTLMRAMAGVQDGLSSSPTSDGAFSFTGAPAEKVMIQVRVPGYEISPEDRLLKSGSATNLIVAGHVTNLVIRLQPR